MDYDAKQHGVSEALSVQIPDNCIGKAGPGTYYSNAISNTLRLCKLTLIAHCPKTVVISPGLID